MAVSQGWEGEGQTGRTHRWSFCRAGPHHPHLIHTMKRGGDIGESFNSARVGYAPTSDTNATPRDALEATPEYLTAKIGKNRVDWSKRGGSPDRACRHRIVSCIMETRLLPYVETKGEYSGESRRGTNLEEPFTTTHRGPRTQRVMSNTPKEMVEKEKPSWGVYY